MLIGDRDRDFGGKAERRARNRDRRAAGAFSGDRSGGTDRGTIRIGTLKGQILRLFGKGGRKA